MSINKEKEYKNKIYEFLLENKNSTFASKEITAALGIHKSTFKIYRNVLNLLVEEEKIIKQKDGKYAIPLQLKPVIGNIQVTKSGAGFVLDEENQQEVYIPSPFINTALNKDLVEIEYLKERRGKNPEGKVIQIVQRERVRFAGVFHKSKYYAFVVVDDPKMYKDFYVPKGMDGGAKDGQIVVVLLEKWVDSSKNPEARVVEILGYADEKGVDISAVMVNNGLSTTFPDQVEEEAKSISSSLNKSDFIGRLDLREELIFTIDPVDAKDFDDAVSLNKLENGNWELGVHIADVSHYVKENSDVDEEAFARATSIYMVDRVVPMLPEYLSNNLCSLKPNEEKLTYTCLMEINENLEVMNYKISPSVIKSKRRLNYQEAQQLIDAKNEKDIISKKLMEMNELAKSLKKLRMQEGGLDFFTPEVKFILDDKGFPVEIVPVKTLNTHQLIEEFMLMANKTVAKHVSKNIFESGKKKSLPFIYRIHEKPAEEKFSKFVNMLNVLGYEFPYPKKISPFFFQDVFKKVKNTKDEVLIDKVALRSLMKAVYSTENVGHFGLGFTHYTHFTSPIRRYPDLWVHRVLKEYSGKINSGRIKFLKNHLNKIADHSSGQERIAVEAERESIKIKQAEWLSRHIGEVFKGQISGVASYGFWVELETTLIEGMVHSNQLSDDIYIYDESQYALIGRHDGKIYRMGNMVEVEVVKVDPDKHEIDFRIIENLDIDLNVERKPKKFNNMVIRKKRKTNKNGKKTFKDKKRSKKDKL